MRCAVNRDRSRGRRRRRDAHQLASRVGARGEREQADGPQRTQRFVVHDGATIAMLPLDVTAGDRRSECAMKRLDANQEYQAGGGHDGTDSGLQDGAARHLEC